MTRRLRILGIDPGSRRTGFGLVDVIDGRPAYLACGAVDSAAGSFPERLKVIFEAVAELVSEYRPDVLSIENVFVARNAQSALKLGQARAAALCATFGHDVAVYEYAPREIKQALVGSGGAAKEQVQHMVTSLLRLDGCPAPDAADALAAALCHAHRRRADGSVRDARVAGYGR